MKKSEKFTFNKIYDNYKKKIDKKVDSIKKKTNLTKTNYKYLGEVKNNKPNGWGSLTEVSKKYPKPFCTNVGEFKNGYLNGLGYIQFGHPLLHIGYFKDGSLNGDGRILYGSLNPKIHNENDDDNDDDNDFNGFEGEFCGGELSGYGIEFNTLFSKFGNNKKKIKNAEIRYKGNWLRGMAHGKGINYYTDIFVCDGNWKYNFAHGKCKIQFYGKEILEGIWENGKLVKKISEVGNTDIYIRNEYKVLYKAHSYIDEISQSYANHVIEQYDSGEW